ncbi:MAG: filamentous hemagglutinin N-terminal domain-containing protein [Alphaproteobacteria bacterium]|nr:filamentous hemagglutinin N-terminal domain-containing protein [Alphaproteobacteria bacterium]
MFLSASLLAAGVQPAGANPADPTVRAGNATFSQNANKLDVYQSTQKAVIDWRSFNIEAGEHTEFHQPSKNSFTLNRVNSNDSSHINGMLSANGNIAVLNPNGVYFGAGAQVDVGGLLVTTSDIDNDDFMNGDMNFTAPGKVGAEIINEGHITAGEAGLVGLVAPNVENRGVIEARLGKVQLVSGDTFTLDMAGDGLINVAVSEDQARKIVNEGQINADGGTIVMSAADARENVDNLIVNKGKLSANSIGMKNGKIVLSAGGSNKTSKSGVATVLNEGVIEAKGNDANESGGSVHMLGDHVGAMANSTIDVSGSAGGGEVLLGGEYQGGGDVQTAARSYVDESAVIEASATEVGDGGRVIIWADEITRYSGQINAEGGAQSGDGGFVEVSGKEHLAYNGLVSTLAANGEDGTLLLDPTDITISNAVDNNVSGTSTFQPSVDDGPSNLNVTTLQNQLVSSNVTVQTRATGSQNGDITVVDPITWTANKILTLDAHNKIYVNAQISGRNKLVLNATDVEINAPILRAANTFNVVFQPRATNISMGIAGGAGTYNLSSAELDFLNSNIAGIYLGNSSSTAAMDLGAYNWNNNVYFYTSTGEMQVNGAQDFGAFQATLQTRNLSLDNTLSGSGALIFRPGGSVSVGLAGAAGTLNLSVAELDNIQDGFNRIDFGQTNSNQPITVNAYTWNDSARFLVNNSDINIDGDQTLVGNNYMTLYGRTLNMSADVYGSNVVIFQPNNANSTIGVGGAAGTYQVDDALLSNFIGFSRIRVGSTAHTGNINIAALDWDDKGLEVFSKTGVINVNGDIDVGAYDLWLRSDVSPVVNGDLIGSGTLRIGQSATNVTMGVAGGAGTVNIGTSILDHIQDGWNLLRFGTTGNDQQLTVNAYNWQDSVSFETDSGVIQIDGAQTVGNNDFTLITDVDPAINAAISGSGVFTLRGEATNRNIGLAGQTGHLLLSVAELDNISDGWSELVFGAEGHTGQLRMGNYTWNDSVHGYGSTGYVYSTAMGANDLTLTLSNLAVYNTISGTGTLTFEQDNVTRTMAVAGGSGSFNISAAEANYIADGWDQIIFGRSDSTARLGVEVHTWNDNVTFLGGSGEIEFDGVQNFGANDVVINGQNLTIRQNLIGTGNLTIATSDANESIGLAGGAGTLNISTSELNRLVDGWNSITIGRSDGTGLMSANTHTWNDQINFLSGSGEIRFDGAQNFGANDVTIQTDSLALNAALSGTGNLDIFQTDMTASIGLGGGAGTLNLDDSELDNLSDGWTSIDIGRADGTGAITMDAYANWADAFTFIKDNSDLSNAISIIGDQTVLGASDGMLNFNGNVELGAAIDTNGNVLTFNDPLTLISNSALTTGAADIAFNNTVDGAFDLALNTSGDIDFNGAVGNTTRLGDVTINGANNVTALGTFKVDELTINASTGTSAFAAVNATNDINIDAQAISGSFLGANGVLNANAGAVNATVSFDALDISGASAALLGGYIGAPGTANQAMANLISVGGVLMPSPDSNYTFEGFTIGYVAPPPASGNDEIVDIVRQTFQPDISLQVTSENQPTEYLFENNLPEFTTDWTKIIDGYLYVHPDLQAMIDISSL